MTAGTIFQDTRTPLALWFRAIWWVVSQKNGASALDYYLDEFTFRFNRRSSRHRGKLFHRLLEHAVAIDPVPYATMVQGVRGPRKKRGHKG